MKQEINRRKFLGTSIAAGAGLTLGAFAPRSRGQHSKTYQTSSPKLGYISPRGSRRIIYVSDPSSIASGYLPDPASEADLRRWVDELAHAQVDTFIQEAYTQGWTTYWRTDGFEYDARPQHRRFLPLLDEGIQPLEVLLEQAHERGMEFLVGIRINDNHGHISVKQGVGFGASFLANNPQWLLKEAPPGPYYQLSSPMDFSFPEVRDYLFSVTEALVSRFHVDGLELCFRDHRYFPPDKGREGQPLMTELVRRIRQMLDQKGRSRNKKLQLGARVYQTVEECQIQGLDVPGWISEGLLNYLAPGDVMYSDLNAPYEQFTQLARASDCLVYPALLPWSSLRMRRRLGGMPISLEQQRAIAQNFYGAGADGVSFYNHFVTLKWAPFYPMMLHDFVELKSPPQVSRGNRHYVFEPIWAGCKGFGGEGRTSTGALKADRIVLRRADSGAGGSYRFRICEDFEQVRRAALLFRGHPMTLKDKLEIRLNGTPISSAAQKRRNDEQRVDMAAVVDVSSRTAAGETLVPEIPSGPILTTWFELTAPPAVYGDNWLEVTLVEADCELSQDLVIDEIEVFIRPKRA